MHSPNLKSSVVTARFFNEGPQPNFLSEGDKTGLTPHSTNHITTLIIVLPAVTTDAPSFWSNHRFTQM